MDHEPRIRVLRGKVQVQHIPVASRAGSGQVICIQYGERSFGKGRVVVFTSTADREWNNWPGHPTYLPMLMETGQCFSPGSCHSAQRICALGC